MSRLFKMIYPAIILALVNDTPEASARSKEVRVPEARKAEAIEAARKGQTTRLRAILSSLGQPVSPRDPIRIEGASGSGDRKIRFIHREMDGENGVKTKYWAVVLE